VQVGITQLADGNKAVDLRTTKNGPELKKEDIETTVTQVRKALSKALDTSGPGWTPADLRRALEKNGWTLP
jgi:hypothetical protein